MSANLSSRLSADLERGATQIGLNLSGDQKDALLVLISELGKWNRAYNLTAIRDPDAMLRKHILDSLSIMPFVYGRHCLDVGTGAGFPGLPLAIAEPDRSWVLLDSNAKKLRFIEHIAATLGIHNVSVVHSRVEDFSTKTPFDTIVCRAFSALDRFAAVAEPRLAAHGRILAMKGRSDHEQYTALEANWQLDSRPLVVPLLEEERHIVELRKRK